MNLNKVYKIFNFSECFKTLVALKRIIFSKKYNSWKYIPQCLHWKGLSLVWIHLLLVRNIIHGNTFHNAYINRLLISVNPCVLFIIVILLKYYHLFVWFTVYHSFIFNHKPQCMVYVIVTNYLWVQKILFVILGYFDP